MLDAWYCLDRVVPEGMSQVRRRSEVGIHERRTLNTWLSFGTSEHTSSSSRNVPGRMIRSDFFWYWNKIKMKPTYREKNLPDWFFGRFRSMIWFNLLSLLETVVWKPLLEGLFAQIHANLSWRVFGRNRTWDLRITRFLQCHALHHWAKVTDESPKIPQDPP